MRKGSSVCELRAKGGLLGEGNDEVLCSLQRLSSYQRRFFALLIPRGHRILRLGPHLATRDDVLVRVFRCRRARTSGHTAQTLLQVDNSDYGSEFGVGV